MTGNDIDIIQSRMLSSRIQDVKKPADTGEDQKLKEACQGFEAIFMEKMIESMRQTLPGDSLFPKSNAMEIFESMYDQNIADELVKSPGGAGLGEFLYNHMKKIS